VIAVRSSTEDGEEVRGVVGGLATAHAHTHTHTHTHIAMITVDGDLNTLSIAMTLSPEQACCLL